MPADHEEEDGGGRASVADANAAVRGGVDGRTSELCPALWVWCLETFFCFWS